jgi:hypothetical protein
MTIDGLLIDPRSLRGLTDLLERLGEDGRQAAGFSATHTTIPWTGEGLINLLSGGHDAVRRSVDAFFRDVDARVAVPAAELVRRSAAAYVHTDGEIAASLPGSDDVATGPGAPPEAHPAAFLDVVEPTRMLRRPDDHESRFPHEPHWSDLASPGALVRDAVWTVTGAAAGLGIIDRAYDPYEWVLKPVVGDWAAVRGCADVLSGLADAAADMSRNVDAAAGTTRTVWIGAGGDGCVAYLSAAAAGLGRAEQPLRDVASAYVGAAEAMHQLRSALASLLNDIADAAIMAAASAAVVALAGSTGVGLPVALVVGAFTLTRIYTVVRGILTAIDAVALGRSAIAAQESALGSFGRLGGDVLLPTLPTPR